MAIFTDTEHRILLSAMTREMDVCRKIDDEMNGIVNLEDVCKSINEKIHSIQYGKSIELSKSQCAFLVYCIKAAARESYPLFNFRIVGKCEGSINDLAIGTAKILGASEFDLECIDRGI